MSVRINDRFQIRRDTHSWMLVEHVAVDQSRKGVKRTTRESHTWYANPAQCCRAILERTGGDCETAAELQDAWKNAVEQIHTALRGREVMA